MCSSMLSGSTDAEPVRLVSLLDRNKVTNQFAVRIAALVQDSFLSGVPVVQVAQEISAECRAWRADDAKKFLGN